MKDSHKKIVRAAAVISAQNLAGKVAPLYQMLNWQWRDEGVPSKEKIEKELLDLTDSVLNNDANSSSCGGLEVGWEEDEDGVRRILYLSFSVTNNIYLDEVL